MVIRLDDEQIGIAEKKLQSKCDFIDWRWWHYYFDNGNIYDSEELLKIIYDD